MISTHIGWVSTQSKHNKARVEYDQPDWGQAGALLSKNALRLL